MEQRFAMAVAGVSVAVGLSIGCANNATLTSAEGAGGVPPSPDSTLYPGPSQQPMYWDIAEVRELGEELQQQSREDKLPPPGTMGGMPGGQRLPGQSFGYLNIPGDIPYLRQKFVTARPANFTGLISHYDDADIHSAAHELYVIVGGGGKLVMDGEILNREYNYGSGIGSPAAQAAASHGGRRINIDRPLDTGEYRGQPVVNGNEYEVSAGSWLIIPVGTPHWWLPEPGEGIVYFDVRFPLPQVRTVSSALSGPSAQTPAAGDPLHPLGDPRVMCPDAVGPCEDQSQAPFRVNGEQLPPEWTTTIPAPMTPRLPAQHTESTYWEIDDIRQAHEILAEAEQNGETVDPNSTLHGFPYWERTFGMFIEHIPETETGNTAKQSMGVAQLIVVMGGAGTVVAGGEISDAMTLTEGGRQIWGELRGSSINGGETFQLKEGDLFTIPPNTPAQFDATSGGLTYLAIKGNAGLYPWELIR